MLTTTDLVIGTDLNALLAPLDDVARGTSLPTPRDAERAYLIGMLAADLTAHALNFHLLQLCTHVGWSEDEAQTIGRAVASLLVRIAQRVE